MPPSQIDGDDDAGDDPISFLAVRENAVIGAAIIYYAAAATLAHCISSARADDLRRHVLRNRPRSVKSWLKKLHQHVTHFREVYPLVSVLLVRLSYRARSVLSHNRSPS